MFLRRTVPAASLPLSVMDAKDHLRVTDSRDDYLVEGYLRAALEAVGEMSGRVLAAETWAMSVASASGDVPLPKCPVISLTSIEYFDANETAQAWRLALEIDDAPVCSRTMTRRFCDRKPGKAGRRPPVVRMQ